MQKKVITTPLGPPAIGPYTQAIQAGNWVFVSGQIPLDPATGKLIEDKSVVAQTRRSLQNIQGILTAAGASLNDVVKVTIYLDDMGDFSEVNGVYSEFFQSSRPARATVQVAGLPMGVAIEIDCIALVD
jgi:2-iminobutanoate/2-iminopropanoate deaminase